MSTRPLEPRLRRTAVLGNVVLVSVWAALLTGVGQAGITVFDADVRHRVVHASRDVIWMAPLSYLLVFAVVGGVLAVIGWAVPRAVTLRVTTIVTLFVALVSLTLPYGMIARWASAAFALGCAVALGNWLSRDGHRWRTQVSRQALVLAVLVLVAGAGTRAARAWSIRRTTSALPTAAADAPNVLLVILDTVRAASMHLYGYKRDNSAVLERLAPESAIFDNAFATAPWTLPSHASMFTGEYPEALSANYTTALSAAAPTLAERLSERGYRTAGFVANHHYTGFDTGLARGFAEYEDYKVSVQQVIRTAWPIQALYFYDPMAFGGSETIVKTEEDKALQVPPKTWADAKRASEVVDEFVTWERTSNDRPFFAFLNMFDAHDPRWSPPDVRRHFRFSLPNTDTYDAAISYMDREVGRALDSLKAHGELDNTIVIVASDHGELFGKHQLWGHANNLYLDVLRVPLVVRYPARVRGGIRVAKAVSLRDLAATVLDLAGAPRTGWLPGASLVPLMTGADTSVGSPVVSFAHQTINLPRRFPAARGNMYSVIDDTWHYIRNLGDNAEELYAWRTDRDEATDVSGSVSGKEESQRLWALIGKGTGAGRTTLGASR